MVKFKQQLSRPWSKGFGAAFVAGTFVGGCFFFRNELMSGVSNVGNYFLLWLGFTLAWFLGTSVVLVLRGSGAGFNLPQSAMMGFFTTIFYAVVCHFFTHVCVF